jgi:mono/diheme cytochrome c family protein
VKRSALQMINDYTPKLYLALVLTLFGGLAAAFAQDIENGRRLSERLCAECHAIGSVAGQGKGVPSFASIANKATVTSEMIASFLRLPHATMTNSPLSARDAQDIAAFIMGMKK